MKYFQGRPNKYALVVCTAVFCALGYFSAQLDAGPVDAASEKRSYFFGVFPFLEQTTLERIFSPIAAELSAAIAKPIHYQSAATFEKFMSNLEEQQYDIAHIQPFDYVSIAVKAGYLPVATRIEMLPAVFVVKADSPLQNAQDLRGKILGLPPKAAAVSYLAKVALHESGLKPGKDVKLSYFKNHDSCMQALLIGDIAACATGRRNMGLFEDRTRQPLRVILTSPEIPQTLFVVHQRVPAADRELIRETLLATRLRGVDPKLRNLFMPSTDEKGAYFRAVTDKDYDIVRHYLKIMEQ
jgi:phosphonate transport system substrate-binding protein